MRSVFYYQRTLPIRLGGSQGRYQPFSSVIARDNVRDVHVMPSCARPAVLLLHAVKTFFRCKCAVVYLKRPNYSAPQYKASLFFLSNSSANFHTRVNMATLDCYFKPVTLTDAIA